MLCELETFQLNDDNRRKSPQAPAFRFDSKVLALGAVGFRDLLLLRKSVKTVLEGDATSVLSLLLSSLHDAWFLILMVVGVLTQTSDYGTG